MYFNESIIHLGKEKTQINSLEKKSSLKRTESFRKFIMTDERIEMRKFQETKIASLELKSALNRKMTNAFHRP